MSAPIPLTESNLKQALAKQKEEFMKLLKEQQDKHDVEIAELKVELAKYKESPTTNNQALIDGIKKANDNLAKVLETSITNSTKIIQSSNDKIHSDLIISIRNGTIQQLCDSIPKLQFNRPSKYTFACFYLSLKKKFTTFFEKEENARYEALFKSFEEEEGTIRNADTSLLYDVVYKKVDETKHGAKIITPVTFASIIDVFQLLEEIRYFHCSPRSIEFNESKAFSMIKYPTYVDSPDGVRDIIYIIKVMKLFHRNVLPLDENELVGKFLEQMDLSYRTKFAKYLERKSVIENEDDFIPDIFQSLAILLEHLSRYEESNKQERILFLHDLNFTNEQRIRAHTRIFNPKTNKQGENENVETVQQFVPGKFKPISLT